MNTIAWKQKVARRFNDAATTYDAAAAIQRHIATTLAENLKAIRLPSHPVVLEVGCGTGFLTEQLAPVLHPALWHATDIAPSMVQACLRRMQPHAINLNGRCMDGEWPDLPPQSVDLVVSNMTAQWFSDCPTALRRLYSLLRPGGILTMTLPGSQTFAEWRSLCSQTGMQTPTPLGPNRDTLAINLPYARISAHKVPMHCANLFEFLDHLRHTGARTAPQQAAPMAVSQMRRLIRITQGHPLIMTYEVLTVIWSRL